MSAPQKKSRVQMTSVFWIIGGICAALLSGLIGWHMGGHSPMTAGAFSVAGLLVVLGIHDMREHKHAIFAGTLLSGIVAYHFLGSMQAAFVASLLAFFVLQETFRFIIRKNAVLPTLLTGTFLAWWAGWHFFDPVTGLICALLAFIGQVGIDDYFLQRKHAILRNFPIIGWFRWGFELIGDELRQYWFMSDTEERPYNRDTRRYIYRSAKGIGNNLGFGTSVDYRGVGTIHILNTNFPINEKLNRGNRMRPIVVGKRRRKPYKCPWPINISGMSWGALSAEAVMALSSGAKYANIHILTGEGGLTDYHRYGVVKPIPRQVMLSYYRDLARHYLSFKRFARPLLPQPEVVGGGRIIVQIGPAKFGFRKLISDCAKKLGIAQATGPLTLHDLQKIANAYYLNGLDIDTLKRLADAGELVALDFDKLESFKDDDQIVGFEFKLAQGAKPGQGGKLPWEKITEILARWRGIPMGKDCYSPNAWDEFKDPETLLKLIAFVQELTGKPVGIKIVVGQEEELHKLARLCKELGINPDFITIDGGEGGTGAAPVVLADHMGLPVFHAIPMVDSILREHGVRDEIVLVASGQIATGGDVAIALALGADMCNIGRGNMLAIGCIMAKRCHTNTCPVGVATQDPRLRRGLDPVDKFIRDANYNVILQRELLMIMKGCGVSTPWELTRHHIKVVTGPFQEKYLDDIHPYPDESGGKRNPELGEMPEDDPDTLDRFGPRLFDTATHLRKAA